MNVDCNRDPVGRDVMQWNWMMDFCKSHDNPPAQKWAWDKAKQAYEKVYNAELTGRGPKKDE